LTGIEALARQFNTDLRVVDVGVNADMHNPLIRNRKIRKATWNIAKQEAMTYNEAVAALLIGIETADEAVNEGYTLLGVGEMGIGNTTTSSAVLCAFTGVPVEQAAGKGAGLGEEAYKRKLDVIQAALRVNKPDPDDPIDVLAKVGGFDIAAMAGAFLGGAFRQVPVVIDGFISMVAALAAARLNPWAKEYMLASHASYEQGFAHAAHALGVTPYLHLKMRLGEGSGCPLMFAVIDAACAVIRDMGTFEQASISGAGTDTFEEYLNQVKEGDNFTI
jgi:nicotinate-nucleotide--dimethylbenzimidazole phosphoribosyltransferase